MPILQEVLQDCISRQNLSIYCLNCLSVCLSVSLLVCRSVQSIYLCLSVSVCLYLLVGQPVHTSVCLSVCLLSVCLFFSAPLSLFAISVSFETIICDVICKTPAYGGASMFSQIRIFDMFIFIDCVLIVQSMRCLIKVCSFSPSVSRAFSDDITFIQLTLLASSNFEDH